MTKAEEVTVLHVAAEMDVVAEKDNENRYLLNSAKVSCVKVGAGSSDVDVNGNYSVNGVVVESDGNCVVEEEHEVKSESDSVTITMHQQEVGVESEEGNETRYLLNGTNTSSVKVGSGSTDVYVNVNGSDSINGVVVEPGYNCIVEEDHEMKSESDPVTITMNQQEVDIVAEKENETRYLLNGANASCVKVGFRSFDVYINGSDSVNGVVVESGDNCIVEDDHEVKSESDSVTITMHQQEVGIEAEKENETSYILNGANTSSVKDGSGSMDVYVKVNGSDSVNGVVVESGDNSIVEEDHEVKSESDSVTITMNQQEVDIVAEKENETRYLLNGANAICVKVGSGSSDVYVNGNDSDNGVVVESDGNCIVEEDHEVKSESNSVTITMHQQEVGIEAEKENEKRYLLNGANRSSDKVGSGSTDVYVNVNGNDSLSGVVVEWDGNCIVEEDHKVKSQSDSVTISMNQQEGEKPVEEKGGYVEEKSGDGDDCLAKQTVQEAAVVIDSSVEKSDSASESSIVIIDSSLKQSDGKVDCLVETDVNSIVIDSVATDDDATHIEIKTDSDSSKSSTTVETDANFVVGSISFSVDVQSNQYNGDLADLEIASQLVDKSLDVASGLKSETDVSSDSISVVASNPAERTCGLTNEGIEFGSFDDEAERKTTFNYMIKVPRNNDESLKVKIRLAQIKVEEKSRTRDGIRNNMQGTRVTCKEYGNDFNAAVSQERKARDLHRSKCREIESMQSVMDIEDIDVKSLKKEADQLKANLKNAEAITKAAKRKYYEETEKLSELQYQFKAANDIQQEAYAQLQSLKKQSYEKSKHFWQYKDDLNKANELASKGDKVALQNFCINQSMVQVEKFMDLWNNNDEFRKEYVRCNERSTLWRLRTLDGRALGPGEVPPVIPRALNGRAVVDHTMPRLTLEDRTEGLVAAEKAEKVLAEKVVEQKKFMESAPPESVSTTASNGDKIKEAEEEKPKRTKEEEESDRKAEELRKEEEAAKLKEQRRLEEITKAKEALERKRRKAEKDEAREANRAAKEAEKKEKKREKRAKKKENQKAVATAGDTVIEDEAPSARSTSETLAETSKEIVNKEKPIAATTERPQKASKLVKQTKVSSIPPPIRNRGKQKRLPWMREIISNYLILDCKGWDLYK
ncbi:proton pump-interactor 1-like [Gossypium australe]|uniref:Proton pump-interactor 1-like n=1 Tax=Gossypium australe TaxID=47621 RepID=A0A5B6U9W4_9ROSI|nr:proton pump-interactor 1-like [Gossypium australe]